MTKKELGLTNSDIAELINNLSDEDFYEVMTLLPKETDYTIGEFIDKCLDEIKTNIKEREREE